LSKAQIRKAFEFGFPPNKLDTMSIPVGYVKLIIEK